MLFGSYLTNFLMDTDNQFGVPALTLVGTLDGLTLSYVYRYCTVYMYNNNLMDTVYYFRNRACCLSEGGRWVIM